MRRKKNKSIILLILLVIGISIGYAYLNTNLQINGSASIDKPTWDVYWDNIQITNGSVDSVNIPATISQNKTEVTFNITLKEPGDFYEFTVDAVNNGTIDTMVNSLTTGVYEANGITPKSLPEYLDYKVTYIDDIPIGNYHLLVAGTIEKYKVRVEFKKDITPDQLPNSDESIVFKCGVDYVQSDESSIPRPLYTGTIYRANEKIVLFDDARDHYLMPRKVYSITIDGEYHHGPTADYDTLEECEAAFTNEYHFDESSGYECKQFLVDPLDIGEYTYDPKELNKDVYLKHHVVNGKVTDAYVCFVTDTEHCLKGHDSNAFSTNSQIVKDYQALYNISSIPSGSNINAPGCYFSSSIAQCMRSGNEPYTIKSESYGYVSVRGNDAFCDVVNDVPWLSSCILY